MSYCTKLKMGCIPLGPRKKEQLNINMPQSSLSPSFQIKVQLFLKKKCSHSHLFRKLFKPLFRQSHSDTKYFQKLNYRNSIAILSYFFKLKNEEQDPNYRCICRFLLPSYLEPTNILCVQQPQLKSWEFPLTFPFLTYLLY